MSDSSRRLGFGVAACILSVASFAGVNGIVRAVVPATLDSVFDGPLGSCRVDDRLTPHRRSSDWARSLLDTEFALAPNDVPADLVSIADQGIDGAGSLRRLVIDDLAAMVDEARAAGASFRVTSAYRSFEHQERTFASLVSAYGSDEALRSAARPGHSEHQLGTTIDVEGGEAWLATNAWRFGFVMSYPPAMSPELTCYKSEPWHFRYVGRATARAVDDSGLSLRAWLWARQAAD